MPETADQKSGVGRRALSAALAFVVVQAVFFVGWIWIETNPSGVEIRVATAPADPRDIFRGQYLELSYEFDNAGNYRDDPESPNVMPAGGEAVYAALAAGAAGLHSPVAYAPTLEEARALAAKRGASDPVILRGRVRSRGSSFDFGINRYFVPEGTPEPPRNRTVVLLLVPGNMRPRLRGLEVDGALWKPGRAEPRE